MKFGYNEKVGAKVESEQLSFPVTHCVTSSPSIFFCPHSPLSKADTRPSAQSAQP